MIEKEKILYVVHSVEAVHRVPLWPEEHLIFHIYLEECFCQKFCSFLSPTRMQKCTSSESLLAWRRQPVPAVLWLRDSSVRSIQVFLSLLMSQLFLEETYCVYDLGTWWYSTEMRSVVSSCAFETTLALLAGMSSIPLLFPSNRTGKIHLNYV